MQHGSTLHLVLRLRGGMLHFTSGRDGGFGELAPAAAARPADIAARGREPVEVVLPDCSTGAPLQG